MDYLMVGSELQFKARTSCEGCKLQNDFANFGQNSICFRCPYFNCGGTNDEQMIPPDGYRDDWAKEWENFFFGDGVEPRLKFSLPVKVTKVEL